MKKLLFVLAVLALAPVHAADKPASEASVRELLDVMHVRQLLNTTYDQMDEAMKTTMLQVAPKNLNEQQRAVMDEMSVKLIVIIKDEMGWEKLESAFVDAYRKSLSQSEINGMLKFYKSKSGKALVEKMPLITQSTMALTMERAKAMSPRIQALQTEMFEKMKAAAN